MRNATDRNEGHSLREWGFVQVQERCGFCGSDIPEGSAAQQVDLRGVKRKRYRGECCAGAAPPNLPASPVFAAPMKLDLSRIEALIPNRTRGALKSMAREHLSAESESAFPAPLPGPTVPHLRMARKTDTAPVDRWLPHTDD